MIGYAVIDINTIEEYAKDHASWTDDNWRGYFYNHQSDISLFKSNGTYAMDPLKNISDMGCLKGLSSHLNDTGQKLQVFYDDGFATVFGYNTIRFVLPSHLVAIEPLKDYDYVSSYSISQITGNGSLINAPQPFGHDTKESLNLKKADIQSALEQIEKSVKTIENGEASELLDLKKKIDALQAEMEDRKKAMIAEMNAKKAEMEAKMAEYQKQLFILETEIYGMRCYLGEVVSFHTVCNGKPADTNEPIVIYQKIRFLNEELGRYLALYDFGDYEDDKGTFLEVLKNREDIKDLLAPGPKSINVAKISRTGTVKGGSDKVANMLKDYEMYHENQLAVLIRNGEQLHIAWLDADKIRLSSEDIFLTPGVTEAEEVEEETKEHGTRSDEFLESIHERARMELLRSAQEKNRKEMISRWFFFNILQGVLDNTTLIRLPEHVSLTKETSPFVIFSAADGWIEASGYGTFDDMLSKSKDIPFKKGDYVLTGTKITRDDSFNRRYESWNNNRGIGDKNRTSGVSLPQREILPINKVLPSLVVKYTANVYKAKLYCDPKGDIMWRHPSGSCSNYKHSDDDVFEYYMTTYTEEITNEIDHEETWEETICPDHWYSYADTVKKLTFNDLCRLSREAEDRTYIISDNVPGKKIYHYEKEAVCADGDQLYALKIKNAEIIALTEYQYYISVKQTGWGGGYTSWSNHETEYHVNFRVYDNEVIPLTFICSTWIKDVIRSGSIGSYSLCSAKMNFADMLPYLNQILAYLQKREETEKNLILAAGGRIFIDKNPEWDVKLCEWKVDNQIHELTFTRAKRFLKNYL